MFTVGPSTTLTPFNLASAARNFPIELTNSLSNIAPIPVPQGIHEAGIASNNLVPLIPFGPSDTLIEGTPKLSKGLVCQKSSPDRRETFSPNESLERTSSTSNILPSV
ncbi:hypothetical protein OGAPHI_001323 [Ogataea philodendri]|uniref:Uncharacterized protein n=1 Tax=Ogataea philodendri TaxID=1378263 RepID=A0A9P8PFB1_9ASCO|nr:uncharacterized protein OGAPHI_001323 [Ogataea philodendri]KAH3670807.1 hypothetical protein OGAPHI_001323 [Ogataea philodendri]